jgi:hypothetical protein
MNIDFFQQNCQSTSNKKKFGLCDKEPPAKEPAYIDETNGSDWIAVVLNENINLVTFTAIDNCIGIKRLDGTDSKRCDGVLSFDNTIIFVELKHRKTKGNTWIKEAEEQLRETILNFEKQDMAEDFKIKKAYIANRALPKFRSSQTSRMDKFHEETNYILRIENRINI